MVKSIKILLKKIYKRFLKIFKKNWWINNYENKKNKSSELV